MALIQWDDSLAVGNPIIDDQHKALVTAYNELHEAMKEGRGLGEVWRTLAFLRDYAIEHFAMEEALMADAAYPGVQEHERLHRDLVAEVADLARRVEAGKAMVTLQVMDFLHTWLVQHIKGEDRRLAEHLRNV